MADLHRHLAATLVNHAIAAEVGAWLAHWLTPQVQRWLIGFSFLGVAVWALFPDKAGRRRGRRPRAHGVFVATAISLFLAEMGDRTQIATAVLAAQYRPLWAVIAGTTAGMLLANVPVVFLGARFTTNCRCAPRASPPHCCSPRWDYGFWCVSIDALF